MATLAPAPSARRHPFAPDAFERVLGVGAAVLLGFVVIAVLKGRRDWGAIPVAIWSHLATMAIALALTPVMLLRPRGDRLHRRLGWIWVTAMFLTALDTFLIRTINPGHFSWIHLLSAYVVVQAPLIVWRARTHNVRAHRNAVRGMVTGALLIAGFFTFPFNRMLGNWLFS